MYVARQLKEQNISEYLLYMWQIEDIIRANACDVDKIKATIVDAYQVEEEQKKEILHWYSDLIQMMYDEQVMQKGHLQINKNVLIWLTDLHLKLSKSPKYPFYHSAYFQTLPYIVELRAKQKGEEASELETCFEALYGVMLLRLQKKEISTDTQKAITQISSFLSLLANYYKKDTQGELQLDE